MRRPQQRKPRSTNPLLPGINPLFRLLRRFGDFAIFTQAAEFTWIYFG
jgi:hypothetical protein